MNWLGRYTKFTAILLLALTTKFAMAKQVEIEDVLGRKVTIDTPAKRVLLGFYIEDYLQSAVKNLLIALPVFPAAGL